MERRRGAGAGEVLLFTVSHVPLDRLCVDTRLPLGLLARALAFFPLCTAQQSVLAYSVLFFLQSTMFTSFFPFIFYFLQTLVPSFFFYKKKRSRKITTVAIVC